MPTHRSYAFEDYVEQASAQTSVDGLFSVYLRAVEQHGLNRAIFSLATDHRDISSSAKLGVIHNYPSDWMSYYFQNGYNYIDPVLIHASKTVGAFSWGDIPQKMELNKQQKRCLALGREAGLNNGVGIMFHGPRNQIAGIGLATSDEKDAFDGNLDLITAYSNHFYLAFKKLKTSNTNDEKPVSLTPKEAAIMTYIAQGKSDSQIAEALAMSPHTVDKYVRSVFQKMNIHSRVTAACKAIVDGLITV